MQDSLAWLIGSYTAEVMGMFWGKDHTPYPVRPRGSKETAPAEHGEKMSDGARFAAFASAHRRQIQERRKK